MNEILQREALWQAEENRRIAQRELEEARAKMYAAQKKYSVAHDAHLAAMEAHRNARPEYSSHNTRPDTKGI